MKKILFFLLFAGISLAANAQFNQSKWTFGGGIGLQFGDYTHINIAPQVGYNLTDYFNVGGGFSYSYFSEKYDHNRYKEENNYLGCNVYGKLYPIPYIVLMIQTEANRVWKSVENRITGEKSKTEKLVPVVLLGGGVRFGPVSFMLQYDIVQDNNSPYGNSFLYSIGYTFGI